MTLTLPKSDGRLVTFEKCLDIYFNHNKEIDNNTFYNEIKKHFSDGKQDSSGMLKKNELIRYFGLIDYSFETRSGKINSRGIRYTNSKYLEEKILIIFESLENDSFGRNNPALLFRKEESTLNPPNIFLRVIDILGSISRIEFAYLLFLMEDKNIEFNEAIKQILKITDSDFKNIDKKVKNKYKDAKFVPFFNHIKITEDIDRRIYFNKEYFKFFSKKLNKLKIFDNIDKSQHNESLKIDKFIKKDYKIKNTNIINSLIKKEPKIAEKKDTKRYETNSLLKKYVFDLCNYKCELNNNHKTFNKNNGDIFMETHHFVPMKAQEDFFPIRLDQPSNIICLCPTCHQMIHHTNYSDRKKILEKFYNERKTKLNNSGIYIDLKILFEKYYL